jgi:hypothetical protein
MHHRRATARAQLVVPVGVPSLLPLLLLLLLVLVSLLSLFVDRPGERRGLQTC